MSSIATHFVRHGKKVSSFEHHSQRPHVRTHTHTHASQIVGIGRNYSEHIKELGNARPKEPFFFLKPTTSYVRSGGNIELPRGVLVHHEGPSVCSLCLVCRVSCIVHRVSCVVLRCPHAAFPVELGLVIGKGGREISQDIAESHIAGYGTYQFEARSA